MRKSNNSQWSFSTSKFLSFKSSNQEQAHQYPPATASSSPAFSQRKLGMESQLYPIISHPWQSKDEVRMFPATNQPTQIVPATIGCAVGAVSLTTPTGPVVGSTDLKSSPSISAGPCQLTLFYNGSVCVYDNISPEKAKAIMLLAGNGESNNNSTALPVALPSLPKVEQPSLLLRPPNKEKDTSVAAGLLSTSSDACVEAAALKSTPSSSAVPQARKASLARFLEKRKERVNTASPYVVTKKGSECSSVGPGAGSALPSISAASSPLSPTT